MATLSMHARPLLEENACARWTPKSLFHTLMNLEVPLDGGGTVRLQITKYLNSSTTPGKDSNGGPGFKALQDGLRKVAKVKGGAWVLPVGLDNSAQMMSMGTELTVQNWELWRFFVGKASPQEIRRTLFLAQVAGVAQATHAALQHYCNQQAGMDCSGFASVAYGVHRWDNQGFSATRYRTLGVERRTIESIQPGDAIVWLHENHIALIDSVERRFQVCPELRCKVAEATAGSLTTKGGVQYSDYFFERDLANMNRQYKCFRPRLNDHRSTELSAAKITVRGNL